MSKVFRIVILVVSISLISPVVQSQIRTEIEIYEGHATMPREVLVQFRPSTRENIARVMRDNDIVFTEGVGDAVLLRSARRDVATLVRELSSRPEVEYAEPNYIVNVFGDLGIQAVPNDASFGSLYGLHNTGQTIQGIAGIADADIDAPEAWNSTTGSKSVVVASVDSGVNLNHPDLAANAWSAPTAFTVTVGGVSVTCPAGTQGYNSITNACGGDDDNNHGTHTSGTMGAVGNNSVGVVGVNWNVSIMRCKFLNSGGSGSTADAVQCLEFVRNTHAAFGGAGGSAAVVATNNSWSGGRRSRTLASEIRKHDQAGILFVAAAGNDGMNIDVDPAFPAGYRMPNIISVAATDNRDGIASFSNFGAETVDLGAPGVNVLSTLRSNNYGFGSGTSMATPHVTGAIALLKAACPTLTSTELKTTILATVDPIPSLTGKTVTGGRLNIGDAISVCAP